MTEQTDAAEVEALRALLTALRYGSHTFTTHEMAERILRSDWLAAREAAAAEQALREAADEADSVGHHWSGAPALAFFALAGDLRDRAAAAGGGGEA